MSDDFNRRKMVWLDRLAADYTLSPAAFRIAYIIANFMNRETGQAWPTQETLATKAGLTDRAVREQIKVLVAAGYLNCEFGGGRHKPNIYTIGEPETRNETSPFKDKNPEGNFPLSTGNPEVSRQKPGTKLPTELLYEPIPSSKAGEDEKIIPLHPPAEPSAEATSPAKQQERDYFRRGKDLLGENAGGLLVKLRQVKGGSIAMARAALEEASEAEDPREYIGAVIRGKGRAPMSKRQHYWGRH